MGDDKKVIYCPGCEREFSVTDRIKIKGGLVLCPNCEVELKPIRMVFFDETYTDERN